MEDINVDGDISDDCLKEYVGLIHELTGITVGANRRALLYSRLHKRIKSLGLKCFGSYLAMVKEQREEQTIFINLVTTNETSFFRTPRVWLHIAETMLPAWHLAHPGKVFKAWSAAASSGAEAYSLAILCQEFKLKHPAFKFKILGTDISQEMVEMAAAGKYSGRPIENFRQCRPQLFDKYLTPQGSNHVVTGDLRSQVEFKRHNLFDTLKTTERFDLVLIRNVLIYFINEDQEQVLANVHKVMAEDGTLIIGESESLTRITTDFSPLVPLVYLPKKKAA